MANIENTTNLTQEQIVTLLVELFVNQNNLDKTYYDMFYNPVPMDIQIQRYDENGVLQTYTIPNRAKDINSNNFMMMGTVNPEGQIQASAGHFYLNTVTYVLFYKATGNATSVYGWLQVYAPPALVNGAFPVNMGGTGTTNISGLIRGNGQNAFSQATEYMNNLNPTDPSYNIANGNISADYMNPRSVINKINELVNTHNESSTAHTDIRASLTSILNTINTYLYDTSTDKYKFSSLGFPDYANRQSRAPVTNYTATEDGWLYVYGIAQGRPGLTVKINGVNFITSSNALGDTGDFAYAGSSIMFPIKKGDTYYFNGYNAGIQAYFMPMR